MIAVIIGVRAVSPDAVTEICRLLAHAVARNQTPGWIHGRCLVDTHDRRLVLDYEEWTSQNAWEAWFNSGARLNLTLNTAPFREGDLQIQVYEEV